jgi:hypothetical protein
LDPAKAQPGAVYLGSAGLFFKEFFKFTEYGILRIFRR